MLLLDACQCIKMNSTFIFTDSLLVFKSNLDKSLFINEIADKADGAFGKVV